MTITVHHVYAATCSCGQDLDGCSREHCPRCGRDLHRTH